MKEELIKLGFTEDDYHFELEINDLTIWVNKEFKEVNLETKRSILSVTLFPYNYEKVKQLIDLLR